MEKSNQENINNENTKNAVNEALKKVIDEAMQQEQPDAKAKESADSVQGKAEKKQNAEHGQNGKQSGAEAKKGQSATDEEVVSFDTPEPEPQKPQVSAEEQRLMADLAAQKDNYLRLRADYDNFRRRNADAVTRARQDGLADAVEAVLPVIDSIDRAYKICTDEKSKEGLALIKKQIESSLSGLGVSEIPTEGETFDPNFHNAVQREEVEGDKVDKVLEVYQRGYKLQGKVIRFSMVKVGVEKE